MAGDYLLVVAAVAPEIQAVLDRISHVSERMIGGRPLRCGRLEGMPLKLLVTGPGILNTVQAVTACVEKAGRPSLMIQTGCGGGFSRLGMANGDIAVAIGEIDVHLGIETGRRHSPLLDLPFPVLKSGGKSLKAVYPLDERVAEAAFLRLKAVFGPQGIGVFKGPFVTGSTVTGSDERADFLFKTYAPCIESMEGAGAAFLSHCYGLPLLEIRCVSNLTGNRDLARWDLAMACRRAGEAAAELIAFFIKEQQDDPFISGLFHLSQ